MLCYAILYYTRLDYTIPYCTLLYYTRTMRANVGSWRYGPYSSQDESRAAPGLLGKVRVIQTKDRKGLQIPKWEVFNYMAHFYVGPKYPNV